MVHPGPTKRRKVTKTTVIEEEVTMIAESQERDQSVPSTSHDSVKQFFDVSSSHQLPPASDNQQSTAARSISSNVPQTQATQLVPPGAEHSTTHTGKTSSNVSQSHATRKAPSSGEHPVLSHKFDFSSSAAVFDSSDSEPSPPSKSGRKRKTADTEGNVPTPGSGAPTSTGKESLPLIQRSGEKAKFAFVSSCVSVHGEQGIQCDHYK